MTPQQKSATPFLETVIKIQDRAQVNKQPSPFEHGFSTMAPSMGHNRIGFRS
jgi:hypothetical protein